MEKRLLFSPFFIFCLIFFLFLILFRFCVLYFFYFLFSLWYFFIFCLIFFLFLLFSLMLFWWGGKMLRSKQRRTNSDFELLFCCELSSLKPSSFVIENWHIIEALKLPSKLILKFESRFVLKFESSDEGLKLLIQIGWNWFKPLNVEYLLAPTEALYIMMRKLWSPHL